MSTCRWSRTASLKRRRSRRSRASAWSSGRSRSPPPVRSDPRLADRHRAPLALARADRRARASPSFPPRASRSPGAARSSPSRSTSSHLPPHVGQAFIAIEDRRFYSPYRHRPVGHRAGHGPQPPRPAASARAAARSPSSSPRPASSARPHRRAQGAGGPDRALAGGVAEQGRDPQPLPLQRLFRRQCLRPARRRASLFQRRAGGSDARAVGDARRRRQRAVAARADPQPRRRAARARGWCCARWSMPATSPRTSRCRRQAGAAAARPARRSSRPAPISPTGCIPQASELADDRLWRAPASGPRSTATSSAPRSAPSAAPGSAAPRPPWSRCGSTAASSRWSAARTMRAAPSTAPPRPAASRARPSSCSSISPPSAPGYTPDTPVDDVPIRLGDWQPRNYGDTYRGRIHVREAVAQSSNSVAVQVSGAGRPQQCHPRRPRPRRHRAAAPRSEPAARRQQHQPDRADRSLCRGRLRPLSDPRRTASPQRAAAGSAVRAPTGSTATAPSRCCATSSIRSPTRHRPRRRSVGADLRQDRHHLRLSRRPVRRLRRRSRRRRLDRQ